MNDHEPLIRVMALHALAYCERLFYLEEVERIQIADDAIYAGRTLHEQLAASEQEKGKWCVMELADETLGLVGKVDCLKRWDGAWIPYEHKRGHPRRDNETTTAWPSDVLQVTAYAMLLEAHTGRPVTEGRIRYHAANITVRVPIDEQARQAVHKAVARARELRSLVQRPPVTDNDRLCIRCSLAPVCLPEEERLATNPEWEPVRLFPADTELKTVHIVERGTRISRSGNTLKIATPYEEPIVLPIHQIGALVLHGYPQISVQAIHHCLGHNITIHFISAGGYYVGSVSQGAGPVQRRIRQYQALMEPGTRLRLTRKLATAKVEGYLRYLLRATRGKDRPSLGVHHSIQDMQHALRGIARAESIDTIRGHEGTAGRAWYDALPTMLSPKLPNEMRPDGRNRRPPRDRFNALLGFGYALLYQAVLQSIQLVGLEPAFGFFHTPRSSAHPLVLDVMELFRLTLWDMPLLGSVNRLHWDPTEDFHITEGRVWLSSTGKKKAIKLFEKRLTDTWRHPIIGYSLSYRRLIELEIRLLEKEWTGEPGLFAKMRLR